MKRRLFVLATGATTLGIALVVPHALGQAAKEPPRRVGLLTVFYRRVLRDLVAGDSRRVA